MEYQVPLQQPVDVIADASEHDVSELTQFQLAIIGGGCAEVCPY